MQKPIILVANGDIADQTWLKSVLLREPMAIIGVDGGANYILELDVIPDIVLGDLDSMSSEHKRLLEQNWVNIFQFDPEKDETDLELALLYVAENQQWDGSMVEVYGAHGGRFDHEIANLMLLTHPALLERDIRLKAPHQTSFLITDKAEVNGRAGDTVSLIPLNGDSVIKRTVNLKWELIDSTLKFGPARGVSNVMTASQSTIEVESGIVLCVHTERSWDR